MQSPSLEQDVRQAVPLALHSNPPHEVVTVLQLPTPAQVLVCSVPLLHATGRQVVPVG
jgi:hypothetical protein